MEGAYTWEKPADGSDIADKIWADVASLPKIPEDQLKVEDPDPPFHDERNPLQVPYHSPSEAEAIGAHLKRSLENVVVEIFSQARKAQQAAGLSISNEPLQVRWVEAYFPFTSPSWELEVMWNGDWLEVLGSGVVKQDLLINAGVPSRIGWAFGVGLERIAMLLFSIPDIRLFWNKDPRFLSQFSSPFPFDPEATAASATPASFALQSFKPYSKYPAAPRDISFWLPTAVSAAGGLLPTTQFHENDLMEVVREVAGNDVEDVTLIDDYTNSKTGKRSLCYRINYRSFDKTLTNDEVTGMHDRLREIAQERLKLELR